MQKGIGYPLELADIGGKVSMENINSVLFSGLYPKTFDIGVFFKKTRNLQYLREISYRNVCNLLQMNFYIHTLSGLFICMTIIVVRWF